MQNNIRNLEISEASTIERYNRCFGFEDPTFLELHSFFKKNVGDTPCEYRLKKTENYDYTRYLG